MIPRTLLLLGLSTGLATATLLSSTLTYAWDCQPGFEDTPENEAAGLCVEHPTPTPTPKHYYTATPTQEVTPSLTPTNVPSFTPTLTPLPTTTPTPSSTPPAATSTPTLAPTSTPIPTNTVAVPSVTPTIALPSPTAPTGGLPSLFIVTQTAPTTIASPTSPAATASTSAPAAPDSRSSSSSSTRFVQVCVYQTTNFGGSYVLRSLEAKTPGLGSLPHAQNFTYGEDYLPDHNTLCAQPVVPTSTPLPPTATPVPPTLTPTAVPQVLAVIVQQPTEEATPTPYPTIMPPPMVIQATPTAAPTEVPMLMPPAQLPLEDYPK